LVGNVDAVVDCIQCLFWQWFLNKVAANSFLLYEWVAKTGHCMIRWGMVFVVVWISVVVVWHVCLVPRVTVVCWGWGRIYCFGWPLGVFVLLFVFSFAFLRFYVLSCCFKGLFLPYLYDLCFFSPVCTSCAKLCL
jgi:hypothetical protein